MEVVGGNVVSTGLTEILENFAAFQDFAYGERGEPVEVDDGLLRLLTAFVALGPFLDVAVQSHGCDVASWYQVAVVAVCHQIGERQVAGVGMVHQLAEADGEGTDGGRHQHIGTAGRLRAALKRSVMERAHLIGMIGEVGVGACVVERELSADKQRTLVVTGREGAAEGSAGLTIGHE